MGKNGEIRSGEKLILECGRIGACHSLTDFDFASACEDFSVWLQGKYVRMEVYARTDESAVNFCRARTNERGTSIYTDSYKWQVPGIVINAECRAVLPINVG